jgi:hypothetical protein
MRFKRENKYISKTKDLINAWKENNKKNMGDKI